MTTETDKLFERAEALCLLAIEDSAYLDAYLAANTAAKTHEHSGWKRKTDMTQQDKILKHLRTAGSITVREALIEYSIQSLTKRVQELRELGFNIVSNVKHHPVTHQKYVRYTLEKSAA